MRVLKDHIVDGDTAHQLSVSVLDAPGAGGANHHYSITGYDTTENPARLDVPPEHGMEVIFQNGPIKEAGVNGVTHEVLLAIVIDRLRSFQDGPFACGPNAIALSGCEVAMYQLQKRTRERIARGVEGTNRQ